MKIMRVINGIETEIELTDRELWEAFEDLTDDELVEMYGMTMAEIDELKEDMAYRYRKYRDNYDESWIGDRDAAITYVLHGN